MQGRDVRELGSGRGLIEGTVFRESLTRGDIGWAIGAGSLALLVYLLTAAPTVTAEDSGELAAAAWTLGIPHPPGYPLFTLVGALWARVFPVGDVAYRLNVLSGLLASVAVALSVLLSLRLSANRLAAASMGLLVAFRPGLWSQATITEVYALSAVSFLLTIHSTILFLLKPTANRLWALAYVSGLSLTAHPSLVFLVPGVFLAVVLHLGGIRKWWGEGLCALGFFFLGLALYLYLPLRSLADPVMDWGNPETLRGFLHHILRVQYEGVTPDPTNPVTDRVLYLGYIAFFEVGVVLLALAAGGLRSLLSFPGEGYWPARRHGIRRAFRAAYVSWLLLFSAGFLFVLNVSLERRVLALNSVFFIPLAFLLAPPGALGLLRLTRALDSRWPSLRARVPSWAIPSVIASVIPLAFLVWNYPTQDRSSYTIAREYAEGILATLPENSIYIASGDHATFPVLYLRMVEHARPDVVSADKYGYLDPRMLRRLSATEEEYRRVMRFDRADRERWLIDRSGRPVFVSAKHTIPEIPTDQFLPVGLLYRVDRERRALAPEEAEALWRSYSFESLDSEYRWIGGLRDISAEYILSEILLHRSEHLFSRGDRGGAIEALRYLKEIASGYKEIVNNAGSVLYERGEFKLAREFYEEALRIDPGYAGCRQNFARMLLSEGRKLGWSAEGIRLAERSLLELEPDVGFLVSLGDAYVETERYRQARDAYIRAGRLTPRESEAWRKAGEVSEEHLGDVKLAKLYYSESLERRPTQPELIEKLHGKEARERFEKKAQAALDAMVERHSPLGGIPGFAEGR